MVKVSVLTPIYNTPEKPLKEAIESILNQTFKDFEFIILNDSPNNLEIEKIVKSYKDKRIKYYKNEKNIGISASRNKLLKLAKGEYIAIFDHDDISLPKRLEKQVNFLNNNKNYGVVSGNIERFPETIISNHPTENLDIKKTLTHSNVVAHTAMMIRKSILDSTGICYEENYSPAEDYMLCIRLIEHTMFYNLPEVLVKYRFTQECTTNKIWDKMQNADALCRCVALEKYPYLVEISHPSKINRYSFWIKLFTFLPILKIKAKNEKQKAFLFGIIPILSWRKYE